MRRGQLPPGAPVHHRLVKWLLFGVLCSLPIGGSVQLYFSRNLILPLLLYLAISLLTFGLYWRDKRNAWRGERRTPEKTLQLLALLGGWPGALLAQQGFLHKTRKWSFQLLFWLIVLLHQTLWLDYLYLHQVLSGAWFARVIG